MDRNTATQIDDERTPSPREIARLEESFRLFTDSTREMEKSYRDLTRRASRIDVELRRTNSELARKVEELQHATANKNDILDALPNGVVVIDATGIITSVNPAAERIIGRPSRELLGRSREALVGSTGEPILVAAEDPRRDEAPVESDVVNLEGSRRRLSRSVAPLADGSELQVLTDLTVVTRLREQVHRLDTLAAVGEMAAGVAHEIRNPLNGIDGFAALLLRAVGKDGGTPDMIRYAENVRRGVGDVDAIITNLLNFAAPDSLRTSQVDVVAMLRSLCEEARELSWGSAGVDLQMHTPLESTLVSGDAVKLKIVFTNLIRNAIDAVNDRGRVAIGVTLDRDRVIIDVRDDGPGVPEEIRPRLFRPFATTKARGTGLGLAIASRFVGLHQGDLTFADAEPGTVFTVTLPVAAITKTETER